MFASLGPISDEDFAYFAGAVRELCAIHLTGAKKELVQTRLTPLIQALNLKSYQEYRKHMQSCPRNGAEWQRLINAITTNKTDFFREAAHMTYMFEKFLPEWNKQNPTRKLRLWCAASSTGEEAYSLAMVLEKFFGGADRYEILASDIDTNVIDHAKNAVYPVSRIGEIPQDFRSNVTVGTGDVKSWFRIKKTIQNRIRFEVKNLISFPFTSFGTFDLIFCRNVFIYFKPETIEEITRYFYDVLQPSGLLCIGHSESIQGLPSCWENVAPSVLRKRSGKAIVSPEPAVVKKPTNVVPTSTTKSNKKRVLIVDDSLTVQKLLSAVIGKDPNLEVVGAIADPREVDNAILTLKPDVMTLDMNMPHKDGCQVLEDIIPKYRTPTVMITALAKEEGTQVLRALELGAVDYIQKPSMGELESMQGLINEKILIAASVKVRAQGVLKTAPLKAQQTKQKASSQFSRMIAIGSSTGGTEALKHILTDLPANIPPIVIVQHIPANFSKALAERLNTLCAFEVKEAEDGDLVLAGRAIIAPGGKHIELVRQGSDLKVRVLDTPAVNRHKPSVDVLFDSVAKHVGASAIGVILTGMGNDGAKGLLKMKNLGSETIAQDEESCVVFGMPREAIAIGAAQFVEPLNGIAKLLLKRLEDGTSKRKTA